MFRRAYRMTYGSFQELHRLLQPEMQRVHKQIQEEAVRKRKNRTRAAPGRVHRKTWKRYVPNGGISTAARLAIALRFFAGGDIYDVAPLFGVGNTDAFYSVWIVVEAVHRTSLFNLIFPQDHDAQRTLAQQFRMRSQAGFDCCVGAVDGILIWILQPKATCCKESKCDATKFFCGRKHKFGLNCQAVSDCRGRFLDMSIRYPASTSDCLAFESWPSRVDFWLKVCVYLETTHILTHPFLLLPTLTCPVVIRTHITFFIHSSGSKSNVLLACLCRDGVFYGVPYQVGFQSEEQLLWFLPWRRSTIFVLTRRILLFFPTLLRMRLI